MIDKPELQIATHLKGDDSTREAKLSESFLFAILVASIPWARVWEWAHGFPMKDRAVYFYQIEAYELRGDYYKAEGPLDFFLNELTWSYLVSFVVRDVGIRPEVFFLAISIACLASFGHFLLERLPWPFLVLLVNPLVIELAFSQLRSALSVAIFLVGVSLWVRRSHWILIFSLIALSLLLHLASVIFVTLALIAAPSNHRAALPRVRGRLVSLLFAGVGITLSIGPLRSMILGAVGDRRAEYGDLPTGLLFSTFWVLLFMALLIDWRYSGQHFESRYSVALLAVVVSSLLTGGYTQRLIGASSPFLVVGAVRLFGGRSGPLVIAFFSFIVVHWLYWLGLLGRGVV